LSVTFYATIPADYFIGERAITHVPKGQAILISASSFETISCRRKKPVHLFVPEIPEQIDDVAVDSGAAMDAGR
jgi:hypothetical protein